MRSRNAREGWYIGTWEGRHLRKHGKVVIYVGDESDPLFPPTRPVPDNGWGWLIASRRARQLLRVRRPRYRTKAARAQLAAEPSANLRSVLASAFGP